MGWGRKMPSRKVLEAREPFSTTLPDGTPLVVGRGDRYYADDPVVAGREKLFTELQVKSSQPAAPTAVETATAAPGERRSVSRGKQVTGSTDESEEQAP